MVSKVRIYLKRVDDYALHGITPKEYTHIDIEDPELAKRLSVEPHPWFVVGAKLVNTTDEPTRETERASLVSEVGECCGGADPMCTAGCLVEKALKKRGRIGT